MKPEAEEDLRIELGDLVERRSPVEASTEDDFEIVLSDTRDLVRKDLDLTLRDSRVEDFEIDLDVTETDLSIARHRQRELDQAARTTVDNWSDNADAIAAELAESDEGIPQQEPARELEEPPVDEVEQIKHAVEGEDDEAVVDDEQPLEAPVAGSVAVDEPVQEQTEAEKEDVFEISNITREVIDQELDACQMTINRIKTIADSYESQRHYLREAFNRGEKLNTYTDHLNRYGRLLKKIDDALIAGRGREVIDLERPLNAEKNHLEDAQDSLIHLTDTIESSQEADYRDKEVAVSLRYAVMQAQEVNGRRY